MDTHQHSLKLKATVLLFVIPLASVLIPTKAWADGPAGGGECRYGESIHFRAANLESNTGGKWEGRVALSNHTGKSVKVQLKFNIVGATKLIETPSLKPGNHTIVPFSVEFSSTSTFLLVNIIVDGRVIPGEVTIYPNGTVDIKC